MTKKSSSGLLLLFLTALLTSCARTDLSGECSATALLHPVSPSYMYYEIDSPTNENLLAYIADLENSLKLCNKDKALAREQLRK